MARLLNMFGVVAALLVVAPQSQAAFITTFTGGDLGEGLNFHGGAGYLYATALNTDGSFTVQGLTFAPRSNTTVSSPATPSPFNASSFGASANDVALRGLLSHPLNDDGMVLTLHGLTAGRSYEVQLLASEVNPNNRNARRRDFDIDFGDDGSDEVSNFNVYANGGNSRTVGSSITQGFTATAPT